MNQDERASQLSAMFDGELPAAECELLSRRLARDEQLRATWSRYSVIGAALRAEPLARVRPDFAHRVSAALAGAAPSRGALRRGRLLRGAALGSAVAAGVAGVAIMMLRNDLPVQEVVATNVSAPAAQVAARAPASMQVASTNLRLVAAAPVAAGAGLASYTVPPLGNDNNLALQGSLADYVVAHSEYSSPLARRNLLSDLVGNEQVQPAPAPPKADGGK